MPRRIAFITALTALILVPCLTVTVSASGWVATSTQAMGPNLVNATDLGAVPASTVLRIDVGLSLRNQVQLNQFVTAVNSPGSPSYGQFLTPSTFDAQYGPTNSQITAVENYLTGEGLTNVQHNPHSLYVTAQGTAAQVETAFNTPIDEYSQTTNTGATQTVYANTQPADVPASLSGMVTAVLGLNDNSTMQVAAHGDGTPAGITSYWAPDFWKVYDAGSTPNGDNVTIAIFAAFDQTQVVSDLRDYEADTADNSPRNGSGGVALNTSLPVDVIKTSPGLTYATNTGDQVEWDMDTQVSTGMADNVAKLDIYDAYDLTDTDVALEFDKFMTDDTAKAGSASFGECEYAPALDGFLVSNDAVLEEAASQGQTVFASAGDSGGFCSVGVPNGVPAGAPDVNYPASSDWVVAVGGTTLEPNSDGSYNTEIAWPSGGGGVSYEEPQPSWQQGVAPPTGATCEGEPVCAGKTLPDIAMDADANVSACNFYNSGSATSNGGTSCASPLSLGVWARLASSHFDSSTNASTLGFAAPLLYAMYQGPQVPTPTPNYAFHDIICCDTGPYAAYPGYDLATGLGSFDISNANAQIGTTSTPTAPQLPAPMCTDYTAPAGGAVPVIPGTVPPNTGNVDSLDIRAGGFHSDGTNLTAQMIVTSLHDGVGGKPAVAGDQDLWYMTWDYSSTEYFLEAQYPGTSGNIDSKSGLPVDFNYGTVIKSPTGGQEYQTTAAATGYLDLTNNIISVTAPLSDLGSPPTNATLTHTGGFTFAGATTPAGGLLYAAKSAGPGSPYVLGTSCTPTATCVSRFTAVRHGSHVAFAWHVVRTVRLVGFRLYAGRHPLDKKLIPVHRSRSYRYTVRSGLKGPYRLHAITQNGTVEVFTATR